MQAFFHTVIARLLGFLRPWHAESDFDQELDTHLAMAVEERIQRGMSPKQARRAARLELGGLSQLREAAHAARGLPWMSGFGLDLQYAWRTFRRAPLAAVTIVVTVAIGLGMVAVLFTILNTLLFRADQVPDVSEMYAVERPQPADGNRSLLTRAQFDALRTETSVFTDAYATVTDINLRVDGRRMAVSLVSGSFFNVVDVKPAMGRAFSPDDDRNGGNPVIVLSNKGWQRHFNRDPGVLGRAVLVNRAPFEIVGVMPEGFRGLEVDAPDFWVPLSRLADFRPGNRGGEDNVGVEIVGRLKPGVSAKSARAQLAAWDSNQSAAAVDGRSMRIDLVPRRGTIPQPLEAIVLFTPLFLAFGLILLIGCANVANLLLARGVARQREIGIRLSLGASRGRIVRQLLTESALLALAAAAGGYLISRVVLEGTVYWALRTVPVDLGAVNIGVPASDWRVALFLVIASVAATAFFALMPALQATRIEPVRTLRGELVRDAAPGRARNALIGMQVFASALLLICAAIFLRSAIASARFNPGFRTGDTVRVDINEPKRAAVLQALAGDRTITAYAAVRPPLLAQPRGAYADTGAGKTPVEYKFVSAEYFDVLGIPIVRGRPFAAAERDDHLVAIVSESLARALWPNGSGIGETFRLEPNLDFRPRFLLEINPAARPNDEVQMQPRVVTVVGVSRDAPGFRLTDVKDARVFLPTSLEAANTSVVARVQGDPDLARQTLIDRLTRIDPNMGNIVTLRTVARLEGFFLQSAFSVALILGALALVLTVSGLFSVLSYLVEQRTKEIGVRMALGASAQKVTQLMLSQTARPVIYGLVAGAGLAATLATVVLATPAGAMIGEIVHVTDFAAYVTSLIVIIVACLLAAWIPAARAARVDPMRALRQE